jgi:hypothetical protein
MNDDIDWLNASSDFGLARLCQEMAALARPVERAIALTTTRARRLPRRRRTVRVAMG